MDSPGLLDRSAAERNEMERLTFASLAVPLSLLTSCHLLLLLM
jgi:GTP1/Obg family GTP-binding protein